MSSDISFSFYITNFLLEFKLALSAPGIELAITMFTNKDTNLSVDLRAPILLVQSGNKMR